MFWLKSPVMQLKDYPWALLFAEDVRITGTSFFINDYLSYAFFGNAFEKKKQKKSLKWSVSILMSEIVLGHASRNSNQNIILLTSWQRTSKLMSKHGHRKGPKCNEVYFNEDGQCLLHGLAAECSKQDWLCPVNSCLLIMLFSWFSVCPCGRECNLRMRPVCACGSQADVTTPLR